MIRRVARITWWISPLLIAAAAVFGSARVAVAHPTQDPPTTQAPPATTTTTAPPYVPAPEDLPELDFGEQAILAQLLERSVQNPCAPTDGSTAGGNAASIVPDDCWGPYPSSHFDIGCDEGAWNHISRKVYCTFTDLAFQGARSSTAMALWMVQWAYGFGVYDRLGGAAVTIADTYDRGLIGPLGLSHLAWFYAIAWAAINALRGRLTLAGGELLTSIVLAGLAGVVLANPAGYLQGTFNTIGAVSGALLATGSGEPPPENGIDAEAVLAPLQAQIHKAFVEDPYDHLNWGGSNLPADCAEMRNLIVAAGPHGNSDTPRVAMQAVGCDAQADFNHDPNGTRLFGAVLTFGAAAIMVVLIALVSLTVVVAQVVAVVLFALAPFAALAAILPGAGRELAWRWLAALLRVVLAVVGMSFVLSLLLLTVQALLAGAADVGLIERFALVNIVVVAMFVARKRIITAGHNLAASMGQRLASRRPGGDRAVPWMAAPALAGATGFAVGASLGPDHSSRSGRVASSARRNHQANRRLRKQQHSADRRAERRAAQTVTRERTEIVTDSEGNPKRRRVLTVDGPAARTQRARRTRDKLERRHGDRFAKANQADRPQRRWTGGPHEGDANAGSPEADASHASEDRKAGNATKRSRPRRPARRSTPTPAARSSEWTSAPPDGDELVDVEDV